jgi:DNA helicase HerA-like ATPase
MKINQNREIGRLYEVHGSYAKAYLTFGAKDDLRVEGQSIERVGKVGQHVTIPCGFEKIVGRINRLTTEDPSFKLSQRSKLPAFPSFTKTIEITLLGIITSNRGKSFFEKGLKGYPSADDIVCAITKDELKLIFLGELDKDSLEIGSLVEDEDEKVNIDAERLFQNHFTLLGATGSGKTCTAIHLIQSILGNKEFKSCHFLILDPHGEYGKAFDCEEYGGEVLHRRIGGDSPKFTDLKSERVDLPHYFFCFSEYKTFFRPAPQTQEPRLRTAIGKMRKEASGGTISEADDDLVADTPRPFDIKSLYKHIFEINKEPSGGGFLGTLGYRIKVSSQISELGFIFDPKFGPKEFNVFRNLLLGFDESGKFHKVTIIDLSYIPRIKNLLVIVTNFLGRCILDYMTGDEVKRGTRHCLVVLEEAHNYVPREFSSIDRSADYDYTLDTFQAMAKEGRKYGACLALSSQRPRDLSEAILSQCGTYFIHRLSNYSDKAIIQAAASEVDAALLEKMPILGKQTCLVMGDAIKSSAEVKITYLKFEPHSASAQIAKLWREEPSCPKTSVDETGAEEVTEPEQSGETEDGLGNDIPF